MSQLEHNSKNNRHIYCKNFFRIILTKFSNNNENLNIIVGIMEEEPLTVEEVEKIAFILLRPFAYLDLYPISIPSEEWVFVIILCCFFETMVVG